ncbi:MAG: hypothetical protein LBF83_11825 [Spirochaetaceae bacterium]|nr:hypothetical protein [Spirochaetaceae bacterium]
MILETGGKISLNTNTSSQMSGGIYINGGNLIMNGGEISDNNGYFRGGGIYVDNMGTVTIQEGVIFRNKTSGSGDMSYIRGGGIYINNNCTVRMNGGTISSNTSCRGGGVYVASSGLFIKRPASGSSTSGIIYGSIGENANSASGNGDAVYRDNGSLHERNATLGYYDEITSQSDTGWE